MKFLKNHQINKEKWDECIARSPHGLVYASSCYLDNLCGGWDGLTGDDYSWVMPLTSNKKFMVSYLYQPSFTQQAGVFAKDMSVPIPWTDVFSFLQDHYNFWEINLNFQTPSFVLQKLNFRTAHNFILHLQQGYDRISGSYHNVLKKNLKLSRHFKLVYGPADYLVCIETYHKHYGNRIKHVGKEKYLGFQKICDRAAVDGRLICRQITDLNKQCLANILLISDGRRIYNIMNTTMPAAKKMQANHFLIDSVIREFSGRDLIFDFEGSDLTGVKAFYESFGAVNQPYFMVQYNKLPWPLRFFKRSTFV